MNIVPVLLPALFCAMLFGSSGLGKLVRPAYYSGLIGTWLPLQPAMARALAFVLGLTELAVALALTRASTLRGASAAAVTLLLVYFAILAWLLYRGRTDLDCGCGGSAGRQKIRGRLLVRNLALAAFAATPLFAPFPASFTPAQVVLALAAALVFQILYAAHEALPSHAVRPRRPHRRGSPS